MELSRRDFVKGLGGAAGLAACLQLPRQAGSTIRAASSEIAMLVDLSKCVGCWWCYAACKQVNGFPETIKPDPDDPPDLAPDTWSTLYVTDNNGQRHYRKQACMHCTDAACVEICPTGALSHHELGFVQYDRELCSGCGYCAEVCPFDVPRFQQKGVMAQMDKCTFCIQRVTQDEQPACAAACPHDAIHFGPRSEMIALGEQRVASLKETSPNASLYGAEELGGLHVMYVLDDLPDARGLPTGPEVPTAIDVRNAFKWLGIGGVGAAIAGFGLNYLVARIRMVRGEKR